MSEELNLDKNAEELGISIEAYMRIAKGSFDESELTLNNLGAAIEENNLEDVQKFSHSLKGVYANLRLHAISDPAAQINDICKEGGDLEEIKKIFAPLQENFHNTKGMLENI